MPKGILVCCVFLCFSFSAQSQDIESLKDTFKINGSIGVRLTAYHMNGSESRRVPFSYLLHGNVTLSKGEFSLPVSVTYSEQDRGFSHPFNEFGIAPSYKWIKLYLGFQYIQWSKFSMGGHQMLGGGLELTPGKFRFGVVAGRLQRASGIDSTKVQNFIPAYKRVGVAAKIGYGNDNSFIDFIYFTAKDVENSLPNQYTDSLLMVQPAKNTVLGLNGRLKIANFMDIYGDGGVSIYNRNVTAELVEFEGSEYFKFLGEPSIASQVYLGFEVGSNFYFKSHNINVFFKRIGPDYQSMGAYFIENDINGYGFRHSFAFWKNKVSVNYGLNIFNDNLLNKKPVTTFRYQPNLNISLNPSANWGIDGSWMDLYTRQRDGFTSVNDTIIMENRNPGYTISPRANWGNTNYYHMVVGSYMNMRMIDNNAFTAVYMQYSSQIINLMYSLSILQRNMGLNFGLNRTQNKTSEFLETGYGGSLGFNQSWREGRVSVNNSLGMQFSDVNKNYSLNTAVNYALSKMHVFGTTMTYLINRTNNINSRDFSEFTATLSYTLNF